MQCDFDTIGTTSNAADIETLFVIHDLMEQIGFSGFRVQVNNRMVLNGLLDKLDLHDKAVGVLRALDKLSKIGRDGVITELVEKVGTTAEQAKQVIELVAADGNTEDVLSRLESLLEGSEQGQIGVARLRELFAACRTAGLDERRVKLDVSIARGLDYYTGTIYETFLDDLPGIGSVCSGGRYDNLAELFTTQALPGVGASLGLDRLLAAMEELEMIESTSTPAAVLMTVLDAEHVGDYLRVARILRAAGIATEVFPDPRALKKQMKYASRRGFRVAIIAGEDEFAAGTWQVKNLAASEQASVEESQLVEHIGGLLAD
jgi:histidyl-tRNA synthetase